MPIRLMAACLTAAGLAVVTAATSAAAPWLAASAAPGAPGHHSSGAVTIIRDEHGVPHVYARTARALFYGDGYATGQDRLWEAEMLRLTATGTVAQELGPGQGGENVQADLAARIYSGGEAALQTSFRRLPAASRIAVQGYADGMNGWIRQAEATGKLPAEYAAMGFRPRPWTAEDVLAVWTAVGGQRGAFGSDELDNSAELSAWKTRFGRGLAGHTESVLVLTVPRASGGRHS